MVLVRTDISIIISWWISYMVVRGINCVYVLLIDARVTTMLEGDPLVDDVLEVQWTIESSHFMFVIV